MTKVIINPGVCGFKAVVHADSEDGQDVTVKVSTGCAAISKMMETLGEIFDAFEVCFTAPGTGLFYEYAAENFKGHVSCPVIAGITKCIEAECGLALKKDVEIRFVEE